MDFTGKITGISIDIPTQKPVVALTADSDLPIQELKELGKREKVDVIVKRHKDKRSLDANAYYWVLLTKLAKVHQWTNQEAHNRLLRRYGQLERLDGQLIAVPLPDTDKTETDILNKVEYHLMPTPKVTMMKGNIYRVYIMLRGSSTYDTVEMARLINGLIEDCRDSGISDSDIMTPFEKQKLYEQYGIGDESAVSENLRNMYS